MIAHSTNSIASARCDASTAKVLLHTRRAMPDLQSKRAIGAGCSSRIHVKVKSTMCPPQLF
eukprot:7940177-Prorocentrum_lima.AAC.1